MGSAAAVEVNHLSFSYRNRSGERQALKEVSFAVQKGQTFGLLGPNGSGKTTLFRTLSTFFPIQSGRIKILGTDLAENPQEVRKHIGVVFQSPALDKKLTVFENLKHQGHLYGLSGSTLRERIQNALERVGLADRARELASELSGGLQRRAELAKGLLHHPQLLLLDEPSTGLDPGARKDVWNYLKELKKEKGTTILLTTHWMEEAERCDHLAIMNEGTLVAEGTPKTLKNDIGGDVISIETDDPELLAQKIREKFGGDPRVVDGTLRIERPQGHQFIPQLVEAFPGLICSTTLGKPTLEDVFIHQTGHKFWKEAQS
ncbi:MAG: ABC transporter ATP-binding protein [Elusimicrobia bacterium]|nr:ABC transporter ATP-binding protein [Elusimicrobiota bacterium]